MQHQYRSGEVGNADRQPVSRDIPGFRSEVDRPSAHIGRTGCGISRSRSSPVSINGEFNVFRSGACRRKNGVQLCFFSQIAACWPPLNGTGSLQGNRHLMKAGYVRKVPSGFERGTKRSTRRNEEKPWSIRRSRIVTGARIIRPYRIVLRKHAVPDILQNPR